MSSTPRLAPHPINPRHDQPASLHSGKIPVEWSYYHQPHSISEFPNGSSRSIGNQLPTLSNTPTMNQSMVNLAHSIRTNSPHKRSEIDAPSSTPSAVVAPDKRDLKMNAGDFMSGTHSSKVTIKNQDGSVLKLETLKKSNPVPSNSGGNRNGHPVKSAESRKRNLEEAIEKLEREARDQVKLEKEASEFGPSESQETLRRFEGGGTSEDVIAPSMSGDGDTTPKELGKKHHLRIDTSTQPPTTVRRRPYPLDLAISRKDTSGPRPSVFSAANFIEDLGQIKYPDGINFPKVEDGKFRYDRDFLLQFMTVCKEKPDMPSLETMGLEPVDETSFEMTPRDPRRQQPPPGSVTLVDPIPQNSVDLGTSSRNKPLISRQSSPTINLTTPSNKPISEKKFSAPPGAGSLGLQIDNLPTNGSQSGLGGHQIGGGSTRKKRGKKRNPITMETPQALPESQVTLQKPGTSNLVAAPIKPVVILEISTYSWGATNKARKARLGMGLFDSGCRSVRALLNKLTPDNFEAISNQIVAKVNGNELEDGRTLVQIIHLIFEQVVRSTKRCNMYARLCQKLIEQISLEVQDESTEDGKGKPFAGSRLFKKLLLIHCWEYFEQIDDASKMEIMVKNKKDKTAKAVQESKSGGSERECSFDDARKGKCQDLAFIEFIGELFKLQMLGERVMHDCVKRLLGNMEDPEEEEIERLCKLLNTAGQSMDTPKACAHLDVYFARLKELRKSPDANARTQFMIQDLVELRERKWVTRDALAAPVAVLAVRGRTAKKKAPEKGSYRAQLDASSGGSCRSESDPKTGPEFGTAGSLGPSRPSGKANDLSYFGRINKAMPGTFGPSSIFAGKKELGRRGSLSQTNSSSNMFAILSQNPESTAEAAAVKSSRPPSRETNVEVNQSGLTEQPIKRKKLQLLPRSKATVKESTPAVTNGDHHSKTLVGDGSSMTEKDAQKKINEDVKEFFGVRNLEEAEVYFTNLPAKHRFRLVEKLVASALESKEADARLVGEFFAQALDKGACDASSFEDGFTPMAGFLDDIAIDAPKAFEHMAIMLRGAGMDKDEERLGRIVGKSMDSDKLLGLVTL